MNAAIEARELMIEIYGLTKVGTKIKEMIADVADASQIGERRIRAIWNEEARAILADELDALRRARDIRKAQRAGEANARARQNYRMEMLDWARRGELLSQRLANIDPEIAVEDVARWRALTRDARRLADGGPQ